MSQLFKTVRRYGLTEEVRQEISIECLEDKPTSTITEALKDERPEDKTTPLRWRIRKIAERLVEEHQAKLAEIGNLPGMDKYEQAKIYFKNVALAAA